MAGHSIPVTDNELESFARNLFTSCGHYYGLIAPHHIFPSRFESPSITSAVVCLQFQMRDALRNCFYKSMDVMDDTVAVGFGIELIEQILTLIQPYYDSDIFNLTLSNMALMVELMLFLHFVDLMVPIPWLTRIWVHIYRNRLESKLIAEGGWNELIQTAGRRYVRTHIFSDLIQDITNLEHPYQGFDLSLDVLMNARRAIFIVAPIRMPLMINEDIALKIMRFIYKRNPILGRRRMWQEMEREEEIRREQLALAQQQEQAAQQQEPPGLDQV